MIKLSKWVPLGNGVWESNHAALGPEVSTVLINSTAQEMGRFPNSNTGDKGYLTIDDFESNTSIIDHALPILPNWKGAEVVIRKKRWAIDRHKIISHKGTTIYYASSSQYNAKVGFGYFIQNHIKTLDRFGEWYYDPIMKKLYVHLGVSSPSENNIEVATLDNLVYLSNISHITLSNISFTGGNKDLLRIKNGGNLTISNCTIKFSGGDGVRVTNHTNFRIENSMISDVNGAGINLSRGNLNPVICANTVDNTGLFPGMGRNSILSGIGILCYGEGALIELNKVLNSGYNGIAIKLDEIIVKNNFISNFCSVKDDGGGIYTSNNSNKELKGAKIIGNIILNGIGAYQGTDADVSKAEGIYMDDDSHKAEIKENTVANCNRGMFLHNARMISASYNTFFNNEVQFAAKHDDLGEPIRNLLVEKNIFFSRLPTQLASHIETRLDDISSMGRFDYNYYVRPLDDEIVLYSVYRNLGEKINEHLALEDWKQRYGKDAHSQKSPIQIPAYSLNKIVSSNKFRAGSFTENDVKVWGNKSTLKWKNDGLLDGGYLEVMPTSKTSSITMNIGELDSNKKYILRYTAIAERSTSIGAYLRYGGTPFSAITPIIYKNISKTRRDYEVLLTPSVSQSPGTLVFTVDNTHTYYLDNIQLFEANADLINPDDYILFAYNNRSKPMKLTLNGDYIDVKNNKHSKVIELAPFSSVVLIQQSGNLEQKAATVSPISLSEESVTKSDSFNLFPNPTTEVLHISYNLPESSKANRASLLIVSVKGQLIKRVPLQVQANAIKASVDVSQLLGGTYIARLVWRNRILGKTFVKE